MTRKGVDGNIPPEPWIVLEHYCRNANQRPYGPEQECAERQAYVLLGKDIYIVSTDSQLLPVKKNQPPPDMRSFTPKSDAVARFVNGN